MGRYAATILPAILLIASAATVITLQAISYQAEAIVLAQTPHLDAATDRHLIAGLAQRLSLASDATFRQELSGTARGYLWRSIALVPASLREKLPVLDLLAGEGDADTAVRRRLAEMIAISRDDDTNALRVRVDAHRPELAARLAEASGESLIAARDEAIHRSRQQREAQLAQAGEAVDALEAALKAARSELLHGGDGKTAEGTARLQALALERGQKERLLQRLRELRDPGAAGRDVNGDLPPRLRDLQEQMARLVGQRDAWAVSLLPTHPKMVKIGDQLRDLDRTVEKEVAAGLRGVAADIASLQTREEALRRDLADLRAKNAGEVTATLRDRERQLDADRARYRAALAEVAEANGWRDSTQDGTRLVLHAPRADWRPVVTGFLVLLSGGLGMAGMVFRRLRVVA